MSRSGTGGNGGHDDVDLDTGVATEDDVETTTVTVTEESDETTTNFDDEGTTEPVEADENPNALRRLYRGQTSFDFVGRRKWWFIFSSLIIIAGLVSLGTRGVNLGIQFKGGTQWAVPSKTLTQAEVQKVATAAGVPAPTVVVLQALDKRTVEIQADLNHLSTSQRSAISTKVIAGLAKAAHVPARDVSTTQVGPTWGGQVTNKALEALIAFFILVAAYISFRFEPKMAVAAFVALIHDMLITAGVYSLAGFQVTPDTVIAVLTILGYSLYDTVVVFTRVRDNTKGFGASGRMTYSEMINLSMNQTLARSLNTSLVAIIPVLSVLLIGAQLLGASTLQNYGLALTVGLISGAYSSIFIASPVLSMLKEREPRYINIRQRLESRGDRYGLLTPSAAALIMGSAAGTPARPSGGGGGGAAALRPGSAAGRKGAAKQSGPVQTAPRGPKGGPSRTAAAAGGGGGGAAGGTRAVTPPRPRKGGPKGKSKSKRRR